MCGTTARQQLNVPLRLTSSTSSQASGGYSQVRTLGPAIPALLTRMSTLSNAASVASRARSTASSTVTSTAKASIRPRAFSSTAALSESLASRSQMAIAAPESRNRSAMARPIPCAPPVTTATRPERSIWFMLAPAPRSDRNDLYPAFIFKTPLPVPPPHNARRSGEKLGIAELHLVWAFALFAVAGVDRCRFADLGNRASREQELADELSETDWQHGDAVDPRRDAQQQIGDHRREDLQPNGVLVVAEELADREMLLDPAEQQFDLPSALVERGDLHGRALKIIGEQGDAAAFVAPHPDAPQRDRQPGVTLADEADLSVIDDGEAVAGPLAHGTIAGGAQTHVGLRAGDEESPGIIDFPPPVEAAIPLVIDVGHAGLDPHLPTDLDIIDVGGGDLDA